MFREHRIRSLLFLVFLTSRYFLIAIICMSKYFHLLSRLRWRSSGVRTSFHKWLQAFCNSFPERRKFTLLNTQLHWHYLTAQFSKTFLCTSKPINCPLNGEHHTRTSTQTVINESHSSMSDERVLVAHFCRYEKKNFSFKYLRYNFASLAMYVGLLFNVAITTIATSVFKRTSQHRLLVVKSETTLCLNANRTVYFCLAQ